MSVLDKVDQTTLREELPKLHSNYYGASESEAEFEFLKVSVSKKYLAISVIWYLYSRNDFVVVAIHTCKCQVFWFQHLSISILWLLEILRLLLVVCLKGEPETDRIRSPLPPSASRKEIPDWHHAWCLLQRSAHF